MHGRTVRDAPVGGFPATGHPTLAPAREPVRLGKRIKRKDFSAISDSNGTAGALARSDAAVKARDANWGAPMAPIYGRCWRRRTAGNRRGRWVDPPSKPKAVKSKAMITRSATWPR